MLIAIAAVRIFPTYTIFTATFDEPLHIADGMEWLDRGTYTNEPQHPPLGRIAVALGPYLSGARSQALDDVAADGNQILFKNDAYFHNLRLARLGNLPFLILCCIVVFLWAARWFSRGTAVCSVLLLTLIPPVLGHAGLATLDMAAAATVMLALYLFLRWIESPNWSQTVLLGVGLAAAFLSKFSSFAFLPVCFAATVAVLLIKPGRRPLANWTTRFAQVTVILLVTFFVVWAGYRFSREKVEITRNGQPLTSQQISNPLFRAVFSIAERPLPLVELASGLQTVQKHNEYGHASFLLGEYRLKGWWYFFPVVLSVKTPIGILALSAAGLGALFLRPRRASWQQAATGIFPILIMLICMGSSINLGVRHILVVYPLISLLAGDFLYECYKQSRRVAFALALGLTFWVAADSIAAHPDYLAYFNQLGSGNPERILAESDLDWGQDLHRLAARLKVLSVQEVAISYFGTAPLDRVGLPAVRGLSPTSPTSGYIAISVHHLTVSNAENGAFEWLKAYRPIERIGSSIYLFYLPD
jgi:hypothetical protein